MRSQRGERPVARVDAVDEHTTGGWVVETGDKVDESRFAGAGFAEDSEFRACGNVEVDVAEHRRPQIVGESEVDVLEVDGSCDSSRFIGGLRPLRTLRTDSRSALRGFPRKLRLFANTRFGGEQLTDFYACRVETLPVVGKPSGLADWAVKHPQV